MINLIGHPRTVVMQTYFGPASWTMIPQDHCGFSVWNTDFTEDLLSASLNCHFCFKYPIRLNLQLAIPVQIWIQLCDELLKWFK